MLIDTFVKALPPFVSTAEADICASWFVSQVDGLSSRTSSGAAFACCRSAATM